MRWRAMSKCISPWPPLAVRVGEDDLLVWSSSRLSGGTVPEHETKPWNLISVKADTSNGVPQNVVRGSVQGRPGLKSSEFSGCQSTCSWQGVCEGCPAPYAHGEKAERCGLNTGYRGVGATVHDVARLFVAPTGCSVADSIQPAAYTSLERPLSTGSATSPKQTEQRQGSAFQIHHWKEHINCVDVGEGQTYAGQDIMPEKSAQRRRGIRHTGSHRRGCEWHHPARDTHTAT
jgi:hypothetical protein